LVGGLSVSVQKFVGGLNREARLTEGLLEFMLLHTALIAENEGFEEVFRPRV